MSQTIIDPAAWQRAEALMEAARAKRREAASLLADAEAKQREANAHWMQALGREIRA